MLTFYTIFPFHFALIFPYLTLTDQKICWQISSEDLCWCVCGDGRWGRGVRLEGDFNAPSLVTCIIV